MPMQTSHLFLEVKGKEHGKEVLGESLRAPVPVFDANP